LHLKPKRTPTTGARKREDDKKKVSFRSKLAYCPNMTVQDNCPSGHFHELDIQVKPILLSHMDFKQTAADYEPSDTAKSTPLDPVATPTLVVVGSDSVGKAVAGGLTTAPPPPPLVPAKTAPRPLPAPPVRIDPGVAQFCDVFETAKHTGLPLSGESTQHNHLCYNCRKKMFHTHPRKCVLVSRLYRDVCIDCVDKHAKKKPTEKEKRQAIRRCAGQCPKCTFDRKAAEVLDYSTDDEPAIPTGRSRLMITNMFQVLSASRPDPESTTPSTSCTESSSGDDTIVASKGAMSESDSDATTTPDKNSDHDSTDLDTPDFTTTEPSSSASESSTDTSDSDSTDTSDLFTDPTSSTDPDSSTTSSSSDTTDSDTSLNTSDFDSIESVVAYDGPCGKYTASDLDTADFITNNTENNSNTQGNLEDVFVDCASYNMTQPTAGIWYGLNLQSRTIYTQGPTAVRPTSRAGSSFFGSRFFGTRSVTEKVTNPAALQIVGKNFHAIDCEYVKDNAFGIRMNEGDGDNPNAFNIYVKHGLTHTRTGLICLELLNELELTYDLKAMKIAGNETAVTRVLKAGSSTMCDKLRQYANPIFLDTCCARVNQELLSREWVSQSVPRNVKSVLDFSKGGPPPS
jgi:hypothetical protein